MISSIGSTPPPPPPQGGSTQQLSTDQESLISETLANYDADNLT